MLLLGRIAHIWNVPTFIIIKFVRQGMWFAEVEKVCQPVSLAARKFSELTEFFWPLKIIFFQCYIFC